MTWTRRVCAGDLYVFDVDTKDGTGRLHERRQRRWMASSAPSSPSYYGPTEQVEMYLNGGGGFHSNDARGTTIRIDPVAGTPMPTTVDPLARQWGAEVGRDVGSPITRIHFTGAPSGG